VLPVVIGTKNTRLTGTSDGTTTQPNQDPENFGPPKGTPHESAALILRIF
jgi:hypothetical protein